MVGVGYILAIGGLGLIHGTPAWKGTGWEVLAQDATLREELQRFEAPSVEC